MSLRAISLLTALGGLAALGVAYGAQDFLKLFPCPLCLWERWPYRTVILLGVLGVLVPSRVFPALAVIALSAAAGLAFLHVGVEHHLWPSPLPECNGILTPGAALPINPAKPCDAPAFLIPGLPVSMALMNFLYALAFTIWLIAYLMKVRRLNA